MRVPRLFQSWRRRKAYQDVDWAKLVERADEVKIPKLGQVETKHFQFVVILVDDTNPEECRAVISRVVDTTIQHATTTQITSSLVLGLLGVPLPKSNSPEVRRALVKALLRQNGDRIRIAHGECDGSVGLLGTDGRFTYSGLIPGLSGILRKLLDTSLGSAVEIERKALNE